MENWGLVTYREQYLLLFENSTFTTKTDMYVFRIDKFMNFKIKNYLIPTVSQ